MAHRVYDHSYRDIFSHPEVVRDLIKDFVQADWVQHLDFSTLEMVKDQHVAEDAQVREQDGVWRLKFNEKEWLYLYIFLEFQSRSDRFMAVRFLSYVGLFLQHLIKTKQLVNNHLPPILPFVVYNGSRRWRAPLNSSELFVKNLPQHLKRHQPHFEYHLLDIGQCVLNETIRDSDSLMAPLIELEQGVQQREEVLSIINKIKARLSSSEFDSYRRALYIYVNRIIGLGKLEPADLIDMEENPMLLQDRMKRYDKSLVAKGREDTLAELTMAIELRKQGFSVKEIHKKTQLPLKLLNAL